MLKLNKYIERSTSVLTGKNNLEHLYTLKDLPVFMGCTNTAVQDDLVVDMIWDICRDTGIIQLRNLIPPDVLYLNQHNDGIGSVWREHYTDFARFIKKHNTGENILEIGGAHDLIASNYTDIDPNAEWTIVEPNPQNINNKKVKVIQGWFDDNFKLDQNVDTVVHSHVFEHVYDPKKFIEHIGNFLKIGDKHIFSFPNMLEQLSRKYTNCLNFEHTVFLTEYFADYLLHESGFEIIEKSYFKDHSIFYAVQKISGIVTINELRSAYDDHRKLFMDFVEHHLKMVEGLNKKITGTTQPVYLFGAHIFSQYLIAFGLKTEKVAGILDNSSAKQGKRLYGTNMTVSSPKILSGKGRVNVILKAGIYNDEIKKDILENINSDVVFW